MEEPVSQWVSPLVSAFWAEAANKYQNVRWIIPGNYTPHWQDLSAYGATHRMATDAVYLARVGYRELDVAQAKAREWLASGKYDPDSLFVLDPAQLAAAASQLDTARDLLAIVDGLYIIAPGWKDCAECAAVGGELSLHDFVTPIDVGTRILFTHSDNGAAYLVEGWSAPEGWGTWSDGPTAKIAIPIRSGHVSRIVIEAGALVLPQHPVQNFEINVNGVLLQGHELTIPSGNLIQIDLPDQARARIEADAVLRVHFEFHNPISPAAIGTSTDQRRLALGLVAVWIQ